MSYPFHIRKGKGERKDMKKISKMTAICGILVVMTGTALTGCSFQDKVNEYSKDKEECLLNTENVTQFTYKGDSYTILEETVPNSGLGAWVGYIRKLTVIDEDGKILQQENTEAADISSLKKIADSDDKAAYIIPFLNVYAAPNDDTFLIVDARGEYHKAVLSRDVTEEQKVFSYRAGGEAEGGSFVLNPQNATQLIRDNIIYQVTSQQVSEAELGNFLDMIAERVTFDVETKLPLSEEDLKKIDWSGTESREREDRMYQGIYEISGVDSSEAVAVEIDGNYYRAEAQ